HVWTGTLRSGYSSRKPLRPWPSLIAVAGCTICQIPEKSGLPSRVRGTAARRFGSPVFVLGIPDDFNRIHCAGLGTANAASANRINLVFRTSNGASQSRAFYNSQSALIRVYRRPLGLPLLVRRCYSPEGRCGQNCPPHTAVLASREPDEHPEAYQSFVRRNCSPI